LSPVLGFIGAILWGYVVGETFSGIALIVVGIVAFVLILWKVPSVISRVLEGFRSRLPEPIYSCVEFGVSGAFFIGGLMLAGIVLLGHMRPESLDWDRILPVMGIGFLVCSLIGWSIGVARRRKLNR
jgi:hypothetical protein